MTPTARNIDLYPWYIFARALVFWQAVWFLVFQDRLSAAEAILLYAVYDVATTALEVPSGYLSDRIGRRITLVLAQVAGVTGAVLLLLGDSFLALAAGQVMMGVAMAFTSGTDSSLLYESLAAEGREGEVERQEVRAWRFGFAGLALSAVTGGAMGMVDLDLPFAATVVGSLAALGAALLLREPRHRTSGARGNLRTLGEALRKPVLCWLFALAVLMYGFSHIPFVFGQPFILEALETRGWAAEAPLVSGIVTGIMMAVSLGTSTIAPWVRQALGLGGILLLAFAMQIALTGALALSNSVFVIALLFLRMVPDSFARPFLLARTQVELSDDSRATYLSIRSLVARLAFAGSLMLFSAEAAPDAPLSYAEIQTILVGYLLAGLPALLVLAATARSARIGDKG